MIPHYSKIHNRFRLDGRYFNHIDLKEVAYSYVKEGLPFEVAVGDFLIDWLNDKTYVEVKTSGSTGAPKTIKLEKKAMVHSAINTGDFFGLNPGDTSLLCLPAKFIAGKMMLVRAMILGLELDMIQPSASIQIEKPYHFVAMTPLQLSNSKNSIDDITILIVGGGKVSYSLKSKFKDSKTQCFETYGMTETITHVAVRPFNEQYFKALPSISISKDKRDCLELMVPYISKEKIRTNDVVELHSSSEFVWLGRFDNVINSGGIKIFPERLEAQLESKIEPNFFITSIPDEDLGEHVALILESESNAIDPKVFNGLDKYAIPKTILNTPKFSFTESGKINRSETLNSILSHA